MTTKQVLKQCLVFQTLNDAELEGVASLAVEKEYEPGTTIVREGDGAEELLVLKEGKLALQMTIPLTQGHGGRNITVDVVTEGEVVGWRVVVEPHIYTYTAVCLQRAKVLAISSARLRALFEENHDIGYKLLKGFITVAASRLDETRRVLISERLLSLEPEKPQK